MRIILIILAVLLVPASAARAADDCGRALREAVDGTFTIVKSMADYKAAMDAGYAACMVNYPEEFAPLREINDFMQGNMQEELDDGLAVLDYLIDNPPGRDAAKACKDEDAARESFKADAHAFIEGQYSKAYVRRHRAMAQADLVSRDQDSCLIVLDMAQKYREYYGDYKQLRHVLFEAMKKQQKERGAVDRASFRLFEKTRERLFPAQD